MIEHISLPSEVSAIALGFLALATVMTSFISGVLGIGGGTILLAFMSVLIPPAALIPVHGVVQLGANSFRALLLAKHVNVTVLLPFVLGSALGSMIGGSVLLQLPSWLIQIAIAVFIVWSVLGTVPAVGRGHIVLAGGFSGFLTMLFGATGPFVSAFVKTLKLPRLAHIGTNSLMMTLQHALKIGVFGILGFNFSDYIILILALLVSVILGTGLGRLVLMRVNEALFIKLLNVVLLVLAARLLWDASTSLLQEMGV